MAKVDIKQFKTSNGGTKTVYSRQFLDQQQNMQQPTTQVVRSTMIQRATGQQIEIPTQANPEVSVQQAAKNIDMAQAISVDLPSRFVFYSFKDLYIKPMRNIHRAKLAAAYQMQAVRPVVEVIDSLLSTSDGQTGLAYQLTEPDFNYLMYWIRIHFFTTVPFTIKAKCTNPEHIKQVEEGKKHKSTLNIVQTINNLVPESKFLPEDYVPDFSQYRPSFIGVSNPPEYFEVAPPSYNDIIELTEDDYFLIDQKDPATGKVEKVPNTAYVYLVNAAAMLRVPGMSLRDRAKLIGDMDDVDYDKLVQASKSIPEYGVNEIVKLKCKECGAVRQVRARLDAHSFFPDL